MDGQAEAIRFFNYPYQAIEEALVNAVYHRGYDVREPVEVRIMEDRIHKSQSLKQMKPKIILLQLYLCMMDLKMKQKTDQEPTKLNEQEMKILEFCKEPHSKKK